MIRLKELRRSRKLLQKDVAEYLQIAVSTYSYWENGTYEPDTNSLNKLAEYFGVTVDYLLGRTDEIPQSNNAPQFITLFNSLSPTQQEKAIAYMEGLLAQ